MKKKNPKNPKLKPSIRGRTSIKQMEEYSPSCLLSDIYVIQIPMKTYPFPLLAK